MCKYSSYIFILMVFGLFSCEEQETKTSSEELFEITCDGEILTGPESKLLKSSNPKFNLKGGQAQSNDFARSGTYSVKSNKNNQYVMSLEIEGISIDEHYVARIWRKGGDESGKLVVAGDKFWKHAPKSVKKDSSGWELLEIDFYVPPNCEKDKMKVYFWNTGESDIYVDDLEFKKITAAHPEYKQNALRIYMSDKQLAKINAIRKTAFDNKMLVTNDDSYVKAILFYGDQELEAKLRLKGDWLDHIGGDKWSFRIRLKKGKSWRGMRTFNIQSPATRSFLDEWVAHKIAEQEDILTTRYEFIPVYLNNKSLGIYVYEEHFEKQLIENKNRREGPILKFTEDQLWLTRLMKSDGYPTFESAVITPFKQNKTIGSEKLFSQFNIAKDQLNSFRNASGKINELFDVDKMAKYLAFNDFVKGYHGMIWHNLRFYYNPVISKLEPIAYDIYSDAGPFDLFNRSLVGNFDKNKVYPNYNTGYNYFSLFSDSSFTAKYVEYVSMFSSEEYLDSTLERYTEELNQLEEMIKKEFTDYEYNRGFLLENQQLLKNELPEMIKKSKDNFAKSLSGKRAKYDESEAVDFHPELISEFVHFYKEDSTYVLQNFLPFSFKIEGYITDEAEAVKLDESIPIEGFKAGPDVQEMTFEHDGINEFMLRMDMDGELYKISIIPWRAPAELTTSDPLPSWPEWVQDEGSVLRITTGKHQVSEPIVIPKDKELIIEKGVEIDFIKGSYFWSKSSVTLNGSAELPILIRSSDGSAKGFTVMQTEKKSIMSHTSFEGFGTFEKGDWILTGAVNFYEADVDVDYCKFLNNHCEDALNIVRSNFQVSNSYFERIFADAFDSDFCQGVVKNTSFKKVGNDAIDFSGSQVLIEGCNIDQVSDKGISGGESSELVVNQCEITACNIGIASKDGSHLKIRDIILNKCKYGFVSYIKKKEYGPGIIEVENYQGNQVGTDHLIEKKSKLVLEGLNIIGTEKKLVEKFY